MNIQIDKKQHQYISRCFDILKGSGAIESLYLKDGNSATRFYDASDAFVKEVSYMNQEGFTCYAGLQPRHDALMDGTRSGQSEDVRMLRLLYADLDPKRPAGTNATDEEKAGALEVARKVQDDFTGKGYQKPVIADSGNGYWLLSNVPEIEINNANRAEISAKLKAWGESIASKYSTDTVKVDQIYDLRRVTKIFGTKIFNNSETEGRLQRLSGFIDDHELIPDEKLRDDFLSIPVEIQETTKSTPEGRTPYNIDRIFESCYAIRFIKEKTESRVKPHSQCQIGP